MSCEWILKYYILVHAASVAAGAASVSAAGAAAPAGLQVALEAATGDSL